MALLHLDHVTAGYGRDPVVVDVSIEVGAGEVVALLGPNGAGKTTLLRVAAGILTPSSGRVLADGRELAGLHAREAALTVSGIAQDDVTEFAFTVREVVAMGRHPHQRPWSAESRDDREAIARAMEVADIVGLSERSITELSGGERRRASLARCLAQDAPVLLLDEPTAHLDLGHEVRALTAVRRLARERGRAALAALHDVNLAALFADRVVLLDKGRIVGEGRPDAVLTEARLGSLYGAPVRVLSHPDRDVPVVVPADHP